MLKRVTVVFFFGVLALLPVRLGHEAPPPPPPAPEAAEVVIPLPDPPPERKWHSRHVVKVWTTKHKDRIFRTVQLPRCEHVEMVVTYRPAPGETCAQVKKRLGAIVVSSGSYHHPQTMSLADLLMRDGHVLMKRRTQRGILATDSDKVADILDEFAKGPGSAVALGARLVPFKLDGFSRAFANEQTDRMAIGLTKGYVFVVQGKSDLWRLADFMKNTLGCSQAINADGGHVVKGRGPVHVAFRWRKTAPAEGAQTAAGAEPGVKPAAGSQVAAGPAGREPAVKPSTGAEPAVSPPVRPPIPVKPPGR